jgi:hypothetical protein
MKAPKGKAESLFSPRSLVVLFLMICCAAAAAEPVAFKTIDRGGQSNIERAREVVVRTATDWIALWKEHALDRQRPAVDFTRSMVVGVFLGTRPTGGYDVEIIRIDREGAELVIRYRERRPDKSDIVTQVITMPYHLVTIDRFVGPIRFTREQ